jgi:hypothetical protein
VPLRCGQASEKRPCTRSRWGEQGGAAAHGDSAIAGPAVVPMPLDPALQEAAAGRAKWRRAAGMRAISEHLIEQLKQGRAPWVKRWSAGERFIHTTR